MTYQGSDNIFFNNNSSDSATVSFYRDTTAYTDYDVTVKVWGRMSDKDRPVKVVIDDIASTAVAGINYLPLQDTFSVKANTDKATIRIRLLKEKAQAGEIFVLALKVLPNQYFAVEPRPAVPLSNGKVLHKDRFSIYFGYRYYIPPYWDTYRSYLGTYSEKKIKLLIEITGIDIIRFYKKSLKENYNTAQCRTFARKLQSYLNNEKEKGNIIRDENGNVIKMGGDAQ
ncbi:DUF4843 domain-containing protein [Chitinophaga polysaccharea]|uniref:DUF4843 domain-containing protein n=1 Tax=Chitinophaga polysaccharea TaxID=1293035 RepID=UPI00163C4644|nr:DUF4843 domain-containing protein [Chitinophaga polysaccharea]